MPTDRGREFAISDHDNLVPRIAVALEPRYGVAREAQRAERQVWLDTFDWRLHAAGLTLAHVTGQGGGRLVLSTSGGEVVAAEPSRARRWPARAEALPAGALRDRIEPVTEPRALLALARTAGTVTRLRVLDGERKTVAWIALEAMSLGRPPAGRADQASGADQAGGVLPVRLLLTPVRGYQADADRAARLLAAADGFAPGGGPASGAALAAAGRQPGGHSDQAGLQLSAAMPARSALAGVLLGLADAIEDNVGFVIRDLDTEFLHDLRVAVRRTRSAVKLAGDALPGGMAARFAPEFKWLGDLTTPVRDLDVYLAGFGEMAAGLSAAAPGDLEPLRAHLAGRRVIERRRLVRGLRSARFHALLAGWRAALEDAAGRGGRRGPDIGQLAADRIARAQRRVAKRGAVIVAAAPGADQPSAGPPAEELHALRKRCKELRYLLEFFCSLYDPAAHRRAVRDLKGLQDCLGEFQDAEVQHDAIRGFAAQMVAARDVPAAVVTSTELAATLLAMGELTARLHEQQRRAREEVAGRFAAFARAGSLRRLGTAPRTGQS